MTKMVFSVLFSWILLGACGALAAQAKNAGSVPAAALSFDKFLLSTWADHKVVLQTKNQAEFGKSSGFKPIEGMQLRFSQNEEIEDRKITLRILPRGFTQLKTLSVLSDGQNRIEELAVKNAITQALVERYTALVEYANAFETHRIWTSISGLRGRRLAMLQTAARSSQARAVDLIRQREDAEQSDVMTGLASAKLKKTIARMKALDSSFHEGPVKIEDLANPSDMLKVVTATTVPDSALESQLAFEDFNRRRDTLKYEIAKDDRFLQFVEFSYEEDKAIKDRAIGVRFAFNIPGFASSELNRSENARELVKYEIEAREAKRKESTLQEEAKQSLSANAELYSSLASIDDRPSEKRMRRLVSQQDPLLGMTMDEEAFQRQLHKLDVSEKAFESYFEFLAASGELAARSKTNFLTKNLREIR